MSSYKSVYLKINSQQKDIYTCWVLTDRVPSVVTTLDFSHCNNFMFALSFEIKYSIKHHCHYESILQKK